MILGLNFSWEDDVTHARSAQSTNVEGKPIEHKSEQGFEELYCFRYF